MATRYRQYPALARLLIRYMKNFFYIADNGAHVRVENKDLYVSKMDLETSHELVRDVRALGNGCECAYCVAGIAYFFTVRSDGLSDYERQHAL